MASMSRQGGCCPQASLVVPEFFTKTVMPGARFSWWRDPAGRGPRGRHLLATHAPRCVWSQLDHDTPTGKSLTVRTWSHRRRVRQKGHRHALRAAVSRRRRQMGCPRETMLQQCPQMCPGSHRIPTWQVPGAAGARPFVPGAQVMLLVVGAPLEMCSSGLAS